MADSTEPDALKDLSLNMPIMNTSLRKTATQKVIAIPELLEMILLNLPECDLLHSQQVCKAFYDTIWSSSNVKKKIWLTAIPANEKQDTEPSLNTLFGAQLDSKSVFYVSWPFACDRDDRTDGEHWLLVLKVIEVDDTGMTSKYILQFIPASHLFHQSDEFYRSIRFIGEGSQMGMQIVKPAVPVEIEYEGFNNYAKASLAPGATLGEMFHKLREWELIIEEDKKKHPTG